MSNGALFWLLATLLCIGIQSFYSMMEMAMVSCNSVRLQYAASRGNRRAGWILNLLDHPARLFGTTLLGVNIALQVGSECSRELYTALHLSPDWAPLTQIFVVMICAELAPMFAARRAPGRVALAGSAILYGSSRILRPIIWLIQQTTELLSKLLGGKAMASLTYLSREELLHLAAMTTSDQKEEGEGVDQLLANIFTFRNKQATSVMTPLAAVRMLPTKATVKELGQFCAQHRIPLVPLYHRHPTNIVATVHPKDALPFSSDTSIMRASHPPWFLTESSSLMEILTGFRHNNQDAGIVLDREGKAVGILTLDDLLEELFGPLPPFTLGTMARHHREPIEPIDRTLPSTMTLAAFNLEMGAKLPEETQTLGKLLEQKLGHPPKEGDSCVIGDYTFSIEEPPHQEPFPIHVRNAP